MEGSGTGEDMLEQDGVDNLVTAARNDIEQVSVRAGCTFTGFEDSDFNGESVTIRAGDEDRHVELNDFNDYADLDEDIESVTCVCNF